MKSGSLALFLLLPALTAGAAEKLSCPNLVTAMQVGNCPSEVELQFTFNGFCSDNRRMYQDDAALCTDYRDYRQHKNVVAWESQDGAFMAYLSCDLPAASVKVARVIRIEVARQGRISRVACHYGEGITFTHRSRREYRLAGPAECAGSPVSCQASCE